MLPASRSTAARPPRRRPPTGGRQFCQCVAFDVTDRKKTFLLENQTGHRLAGGQRRRYRTGAGGAAAAAGGRLVGPADAGVDGDGDGGGGRGGGGGVRRHAQQPRATDAAHQQLLGQLPQLLAPEPALQRAQDAPRRAAPLRAAPRTGTGRFY